MHSRLAILASMFTGFAAACSSSSPPPKTGGQEPVRADVVLVGGVIETLDPATSGATAVAVQNGKILRVGSDAEVNALAGPKTRVVVLGGRTVVPGLADAHLHLQGLGRRKFGVDLVGTKSIDEVRARLREAIAKAEKGAWVRGRGWDQNDWEAGRKKGAKFPTAKDLDAISPDNPVVLTRIDGHAIWVNSKALAAAGITAKSKAPAGGEIVKVGGKPSGIFIDNAAELIQEKMPPLSKEELASAVRLGQEECLAAGLTQVHDMGVDAATLEVLKDLDARGELRLRVYAFLDGSTQDLTTLLAAGPIAPANDGSRLTVRGVKFFVDGALGSRGAALLEPYTDDRKTSGLILTPPDALEAKIREASGRGYQIATHAIGDRGNRVVLDLYEKVLGPDLAQARWRVEHAQVLAPQELPRFAQLGVIPSVQPKHATSDMPWAPKRLGPVRITGAYAWRSLLTRGATLAAGSDAPVEEVSPVEGLYAAVTRKDDLGVPEEGWLPAERLTPIEALAAFTRGAAYASFREHEAGQVKAGFAADLTVLDKDPLKTPEAELALLRVEMTIVGGQVAYDRAAPATTTTSTTAVP